MRPGKELASFAVVALLAACAGPRQRSASAGAWLRAACDDTAVFAARASGAVTQNTPESMARLWIEQCGLDAVVRLTTELVRFRTVSAEQSARDGEAFVAMAGFLESWARDAGLSFRTVGANDVWEVSLGSGRRTVGFVMHADVVPAGDGFNAAGDGGLPPGWTQPPFDARVVDGRLYGRGSEDDKGPVAASLVVLAALKAFGYAPRGMLVSIMGTGEEHDWDGMVRYADSQPAATAMISVDASFPVVVAESGFVVWRLGVERHPSAGPTERAAVVDVNGGNFLTQVPGEATMRLQPAAGETVDALLARARTAAADEQSARAAHGGSFRVSAEVGGDTVVVRALGKAVHSSTADDGHNALWALASTAGRLDLEPSAETLILRAIRERFDNDLWGEKLGIAYEHDLMGRLLVVPTVLRSEPGLVKLSINMRRPAGKSNEEFVVALEEALKRMQADIDQRIHEVDERYVGDPAMASTDGPLVDTLMQVYREETGDDASKPIAIRGGTYARLFDGAVSFGPAMPNAVYRGHSPDEYIEVEVLHALTRMLFEAAVRLDR